MLSESVERFCVAADLSREVVDLLVVGYEMNEAQTEWVITRVMSHLDHNPAAHDALEQFQRFAAEAEERAQN